MILSHIDVVSLFDIDLSRKRRIPALDKLLDTTAGSSAFSRYVESFEWLFEAQYVPVNSKFRNVDPTVRLLSPNVNCPYSLEHFDRFALRADSTDSTDMGGVITLSRELQAAIVCVWNRMPNGSDPLRIKHSLPVDIPQSYLRQLSGIFDYIAEGQLMYPFISLRCTQTELSEIISENDVALGRLVSGGLDHESDETMRKYVSASLSQRRYEGLFLLSSGGAGIYSSYDFFEKRYQNTKTTALALLAVATYVADKLNAWGAIKHLMFYVFSLK